MLAFDRQFNLFPGHLQRERHVICGLGTTGSWLAHNLMYMGVAPEGVTVVDPDKVEDHNLPAQFMAGEKEPKVLSWYKALRGRGYRDELGNDPAMLMTKIEGLELKELVPAANIWSCFDNVAARRCLADKVMAAEGQPMSFVDLRMGSEGGTAVILINPTGRDWENYGKSLEVGFVGKNPCGREAFLPTAQALIGATLVMWSAIRRGEREPVQRIRWDFKRGVAFEEELP